ncbi:MAG: radical SAM protein [bacterium]|nr:radical SAM protein [bacterium]
MDYIYRKSLLYHSGVEYADFCLNHAEGCSHGCKYPCYAFLMKKRCGIVKTYDEWRRPKIVANALELLDREIPRYRKRIKYVHLCFSTDPFMYQQEEIADLSLKIIHKLNFNSINCTILTKGIYPEEIVRLQALNPDNEYGISIVSLNDDFRKEYEPWTAVFKERIASLKYLHNRGLKTWVSMEPYPTPNFIEQDISEILKAVAFVDKIVFGRINYSAKAGLWKDHKKFYNELSKTVIRFCKKNEIGYHIKDGTYV